MLSQIEKLYHISKKKEKLIIGLMSGTSLDGLDIALCKVVGSTMNTSVELIEFSTYGYTQETKTLIEDVFCKENIELQKLCLLHNYLAHLHSNYILSALQNWKVNKANVDVIASHGQTIYHAPKHKHLLQQFDNATLQIVDGDIIATKTGIITISDFRQKNIAAGGSGAPLALYGDYFLFSNENENRILLNIGGIANFTYLPGNKNFNEIFCSDVGPGNTLMDNYCKENFNCNFDENGKLASKGQVNEDLLNALLNHSFFEESFPKSTGQEIFNKQFLYNAIHASNTIQISHTDVLATLNMYTATCISNAIIQNINNSNYVIYASGGGVNNKTLLQNIQLLLPKIKVENTNVLGINAEAKEAILFAILANERLSGEEDFYSSTKTNYPKVTMGKISFPK